MICLEASTWSYWLVTRSIWILVALIGVVILIYTATVTGTNDDYCTSSLPTAPGAWLEHIYEAYHSWTGRWAAMGIYGLVFPHLEVTSTAYKLFILMSLPIWILSFYLMTQIVYRNMLSIRQKLAVATLLTAIYWSGMPSPGQTWYWATGSVEYQIPFLLTVTGASLLFSRHAFAGPLASKLAISLGVLLLLVFVSGMNELITIYFLGIVMVRIFISVSLKDYVMLTALAVIASVGAIALAFTVSAPGSALRALHYPGGGTLAGFLRGIFGATHESIFAWLVDPKLIAFSLLVLAGPMALVRVPLSPDRMASALPRWAGGWALLPIGAVLCVFLGRVVYAYKLGDQPPARLSNILYAFFIFGLLVSLPAICDKVYAAFPSLHSHRKNLFILASAMLVLSLLSSANLAHGIQDARETVFEWYPSELARLRHIESSVANGNPDVVVEKLPFRPRLYLHSEWSEDPDEWKMECVARYFGANSVRVGR